MVYSSFLVYEFFEKMIYLEILDVVFFNFKEN